MGLDHTAYSRAYMARRRAVVQRKWRGKGEVGCASGYIKTQIPSEWWGQTVEVTVRPKEYRTSYLTRRGKR